MIPYKNKILSIVIASAFSSTVFAQTPATPAPVPAPAAAPAAPALPPYKGETFDKIKSTGKVVIGYRSSSVPISFVDENKKPIGYGVDICMAIVGKIKDKLAMPNLAVEFVEVTGATRIPLTVAGKVDMECGSTTNNAGRRKEVDFSVPYYMAGIRILAKTNSGIQSLNDLRGRKVSVGDKTSSIPLLEKLSKERDMKITLVVEKDFAGALDAVKTGKADAFVLDDLLLFGERSKVSDPQNYAVVGDFLSVEPLAIMIRKDDPKFKTFVDKEMTTMITNGGINVFYKKWFESPIPPKNQNLNIPQSPLLKDVFRMPTSIVGN
jgi:ABC-type amino acid transport substrate-binding protein